jgi:hypothetical protein
MKMTTLLTPISRFLLVGAILSSQTAFAQPSPTTASQASLGPGGTTNGITVKAVRDWYAAFEKKDWNLMQQVLADGFTFSSPLDDHISLANFKERCWPNSANIKRVDVDKIVINGDDVVVITNGYTNANKLFRNCDCFKLKDGKIAAFECFFGPGVNYPDSGK